MLWLEPSLFLTCRMIPLLDLGKSIPFNVLAILAAEVDEDFNALLPPFLLGGSNFAIRAAPLGLFPLFNSPNAMATSAESLYIRSGNEPIRINSAGLPLEILCLAILSNSCFDLGYLMPFSSLSRSAALGALGGWAVSVCRSSLDLCSKPLLQKGHTNCEFTDISVVVLSLVYWSSMKDQT